MTKSKEPNMIRTLCLLITLLVLSVAHSGCQSVPQDRAAMTPAKQVEAAIAVKDDAVAKALSAAASADAQFAAVDRLTAEAGPAPGAVRGYPVANRAELLRQRAIACRSASFQYRQMALATLATAQTMEKESDRQKLFDQYAACKEMSEKLMQLSRDYAIQAQQTASTK